MTPLDHAANLRGIAAGMRAEGSSYADGRAVSAWLDQAAAEIECSVYAQEAVLAFLEGWGDDDLHKEIAAIFRRSRGPI